VTESARGLVSVVVSDFGSGALLPEPISSIERLRGFVFVDLLLVVDVADDLFRLLLVGEAGP